MEAPQLLRRKLIFYLLADSTASSGKCARCSVHKTLYSFVMVMQALFFNAGTDNIQPL
jgi:hypothetical protein